MFFNGDLKSAIALAIQESKIVACLIRGVDDVSSLWEAEYLKDEQITRALALRAVTLRIADGSPEFQSLSEYYPIPAVPAFILIRNGQPVLDLRSGEAQDTFKAAVLKSLVDDSPPSCSTSESDPTTQTLVPGTAVTLNSIPDTSTPNLDLQSSATPSTTTSSSVSYTRENLSTTTRPAPQPAVALNAAVTPPSSSTTTSDADPLPSPGSPSSQASQIVQNLLLERARRLEEDKQQKEAKEKAERKKRSEIRQASTSADTNLAKAKQATYAQQQRKRQQEAKSERERILRQIQHDRAERKEKEVLRKALAEVDDTGNDGAGGLVDKQLSDEIQGGHLLASFEKCAIQVRMFDGSTIRGRFGPEQTLGSSIRGWVDQQRSDGDIPYTFKQILAPLPNRSLSISDEEDSLRTLSLFPSATLVMVPVKGSIAAYSANQGFLSRAVTAGYTLGSCGGSLVVDALGTFLGFGQTIMNGEPAESENMGPGNPSHANTGVHDRAVSSGINIRTLRDQRDHEDHQLYNGNQLNFEPRRDIEGSEN